MQIGWKKWAFNSQLLKQKVRSASNNIQINKIPITKAIPVTKQENKNMVGKLTCTKN